MDHPGDSVSASLRAVKRRLKLGQPMSWLASANCPQDAAYGMAMRSSDSGTRRALRSARRAEGRSDRKSPRPRLPVRPGCRACAPCALEHGPVALDSRAERYRYHHRFGEVLQLARGREAARELRRQAAAWCSAHGLTEEAIEYAAAAGDVEMVAEALIEGNLELIWSGRLKQFRGWVRRLLAELLNSSVQW